MIKDNQKIFNRLHVLLDALVIIMTYVCAWFLKFRSGIEPFYTGPEIGTLSGRTYFSALYLIVPGYLFLYYLFNMYTAKRAGSIKREVYNVIRANTVGFVLFIGALFVLHLDDFSRTMIFYFYVFNIIGDSAFRLAIHKWLRVLRKKGYNVKYILLVGYSRAAELYIDRIRQNPQWGYVVRGILDDKIPRGIEYRGVKVIGQIDNLFYILPQNKLDEIAVTLALEDYGRLEEIVSLCEKSGVHTKFIPDYNSVLPTRPYTEDLMGLPVVNIRKVPLNNMFNRFWKRAMDIVGASMALVLFSPVIVLVMLLIKITSGGPVFYVQERVGLHNTTFKMYKFRSMKVQSEGRDKKAWTKEDDPRVTGFGKFIRKTSIDEIPQLINILKGDMSLVGPRPERPYFVDKFKEEIPRYMIKHQVRPGMTGWAQVNGYRGNTSIKKRVTYDLYYIENWTVGFDIMILFMTIFKGFINKNAY